MKIYYKNETVKVNIKSHDKIKKEVKSIINILLSKSEYDRNYTTQISINEKLYNIEFHHNVDNHVIVTVENGKWAFPKEMQVDTIIDENDKIEGYYVSYNNIQKLTWHIQFDMLFSYCRGDKMNKKYERVTINFKDEDLQILEELKKLAKKNRRSLSAEIQIILENKIKN